MLSDWKSFFLGDQLLPLTVGGRFYTVRCYRDSEGKKQPRSSEQEKET